MLFIILTVAMQTMVAFSLSTTEITLKSSGLISYSQLPSLTRPLHVEGNRIKNDLGQVVYLRGWNKGGRTYETKEFTWVIWKEYSTARANLTLDRMKFYGANCMRFMFNFYSWINNYPTPLEEGGSMGYRQCIDDVLTRAEQRGIYVILAPYGVYPKDCPVHGWAGCKFQDVMGFDPYTTAGHEGLIPNSAAFTNWIVNVVDVLGSHTNLIIEFYNENWYGYTGDYYTNLWQSVWQNTINAVRQKETERGYVKHLILVQFGANLVYGPGYDLAGSWSNFNWYWSHPLTDPANNLVYSQHCYRNSGSVGTQLPKDTRPSDYNTLKSIYDEQKVDDISRKVPVLIGEIGAYMTIGGEDAFLENSLKIFNEWGIGYLGWAWWDAGLKCDQLQQDTEKTTGGTVNQYGQILVDAIKQGS